MTYLWNSQTNLWRSQRLGGIISKISNIKNIQGRKKSDTIWSATKKVTRSGWRNLWASQSIYGLHKRHIRINIIWSFMRAQIPVKIGILHCQIAENHENLRDSQIALWDSQNSQPWSKLPTRLAIVYHLSAQLRVVFEIEHSVESRFWKGLHSERVLCAGSALVGGEGIGVEK